jgi:hypothetical protein
MASSTGVTLLLKMENHSKTCVVLTHYLLPKSYFQYSGSLCSIFPILKQNFMHNEAEVFALLGCYGTYVDICLPTFGRHSSRVKQSKQILLGLLVPRRWDQ